MDRVACAERAVPVMAPLYSWPVKFWTLTVLVEGFEARLSGNPL
jgi:hypothetical protein